MDMMEVFCGKQKNKSSKKNMFAKPKTTGGNNAACALAAKKLGIQ